MRLVSLVESSEGAKLKRDGRQHRDDGIGLADERNEGVRQATTSGDPVATSSGVRRRVRRGEG